MQKYGQILCAHKPYFLMLGHICSYTSQKYTTNVMEFDRTVWLTIFTYDQTYGVFVRILSNDRPLYFSLQWIYQIIHH